MTDGRVEVSIVTPIYNEFDSIPLLYEQLVNALNPLDCPYEIIFVDDGSSDGSLDRLRELAASDPSVKVITFRRNYGQTAAMYAGMQAAEGDVTVTLDSDLQNDPADIPMMLDKIDEGYDLVHGWRKNRQDTFINRKLPSKIANWVISRTTGFPIHDLGCTLKAIRTEVSKELELYGEMHRFIPILAHQRGAKCAEVVTNHHARQFGETSYGISRTFRVVLDLITVKYMLDYFASPMKLFGSIGLWCGAAGMTSIVATVAMKLFASFDMTGNPLLLLGAFCGIAAVQFMSLGLLGEVNARIYFSDQHKTTYAVREWINFDTSNQLRTHRAA